MINGTGEKSITINLGCVAAYGFWLLTVLLLAIGTVLEHMTWQNWGLACSAAAATATIRSYFVNTNRMMRNVFELGVDKGRSEAPTPLRPPVPR